MRKKLFAILMSAMMMVTFMPAMAFAATAVNPVSNLKTFYVDSWSSDWTAATGRYKIDAGDSVSTRTIATVKALSASTGAIEVTPEAQAVNCDSVAVGTVVDGVNVPTVQSYYDFSAMTWDAAPTMTNIAFAAMFIESDGSGMTTHKLSSTEEKFNVKAPTGVTGTYAYSKSLDNYDVMVTATGYDMTKAYEKQTVTLHFVAVPTSTSAIKAVGELKDVTITVDAKTATTDSVAFYVDNAKTAFAGTPLAATVQYDGAEHTVIASEVPGYTVKFQKLNEKTWKYEDVEKVSVKDAKAPYSLRALITETKTNTTITKDLKLTVRAATTGLTYGFDSDEYVAVKGFNARNFVEFAIPAVSPTDLVKDAANAKAIKANEELLNKYFDYFYEIKTTASKKDPTSATVEIQKKDLSEVTMADRNAVVAEYKTLMNNFGLSIDATTNFEGQLIAKTGYVKADVANFNDVEFVKAPLKKVYKVKALKKGAKKFYVKAESSLGSTITYELTKGGASIKINKNTGKVTVKKGLKKGTYKVEVAAYATSAYGRQSGYNNYEMKVVVK